MDESIVGMLMAEAIMGLPSAEREKALGYAADARQNARQTEAEWKQAKLFLTGTQW